MFYFFILSVALTLCFIGGGTSQKYRTDFMSVEFTTAIKGFAILTVIWAHSGAHFSVGGIQFIAGIGVALFLICSGYGLEKAFLKNGNRDFWKKRFLRLCIPYWCVNVVGESISAKLSLDAFLGKMIFIQAGWYIKYVLVCYCLFYLLKVIRIKGNFSEKIEILICFTVFTIWFITDSLFWANSDIPFLAARQMLCFPFGILLAKYRNAKEKMNYTTAILAGIIGIACIAITQLPVVKDSPVLILNIISLFTVFPMALTVLIIFDNVMLLTNNRFLLFSGVISYELFLIHSYTEHMLKPSLTSICGSLVITYVIAYCLYRVLNRRIKKDDRFDCCDINKKRRKKH